MAVLEALTTAGLTALTDAYNADQEIEISYVRLGTGRTAPTVGDTDVETRFAPDKKFNITAVVELAGNKLGFMFEDRTANVYDYSEIGVYTAADVLVYRAVETDATKHLGRKATTDGYILGYNTSMDPTLLANVTFPVGTPLPATESRAGLVQKATLTKALAGSDDSDVLTVSKAKAMIERFGMSSPRLILQTTATSPWDGGADATLQGLAKPHSGQWLNNADAQLKAYGPLAGCSLVKGGIHFDWTDAGITSVDLTFELQGDYLAGMNSENETDALAAQFGLVKTGGGLAYADLIIKNATVEAYASQYAWALGGRYATVWHAKDQSGVYSAADLSSLSLSPVAARNVDRNWRVYSMTSGVVTVSRNDYLLVAGASGLAPFRLLGTLLAVN